MSGAITGAISGGLGLASGLAGMIGGLRGAKSAGNAGIAPLFYMLSGQEQQAAAADEAGNYSKQASLAYEQSLQDATQKQRQVRAFKEEQALRFASSGGTLEGSPLAVLAETQVLGDQEVASIKRRGEEVSKLYEAEGLQMLRQGSAAAFSGFAQSLQSRYDAQQRASQLRTQAFQSGIAGLQAGVQGAGLFASSDRGKQVGRSFLDWFKSTPDPQPLAGPINPTI